MRRGITKGLVAAVACATVGGALAAVPAEATVEPRSAVADPATAWTTGPYYGGRGTYFADVDGDSKADAIVVNNDRVTVRRSTGSSFASPLGWTSNPYYGSRGTAFADATGDGKADAIVVNDAGITVRRSNGGLFSGNETWTSGGFYGTRGTHFADVDGDWKADAIAVNDDGVTVRRSTGTGFGPAQAWIAEPYYGALATAFADVTGDGRADAMVVNDWGIVVRRSDGVRFGGNEDWTGGSFYGRRGTTFADLTGDGVADAITIGDDAVRVRPSTGNRFGTVEAFISNPFYGSRATAFADLTGEGRADGIVVNDSNIDVRTAHVNGPGGYPWTVSVGDSFISGEGGRWAGNTDNLGSGAVDAGKRSTYWDAGGGSYEAIPGCHRSRSAEIHIGNNVSPGIGTPTRSLNLACSGATTRTTFDGDFFKPGFDWYSDAQGRKSQPLMLQDFATDNNVRMVTISIGGNDFHFSDIVKACLHHFVRSTRAAEWHCGSDPDVNKWISPSSVAERTADVYWAIQRVGEAMRRAGYAETNYTIVVQGYVSPITTARYIRYKGEGNERWTTGGCGFWDEDLDWMNFRVLPAINGAVRAAVERTGKPNVRFLDVAEANAGHALCDERSGLLEEKGLTSWSQAGASDLTEWVNQIRTVENVGSEYELNESIHPNYWGQLAMRNCLRQAYNRGVPLSGRCTPLAERNSWGEPNVRFTRPPNLVVPSVVGMTEVEAEAHVRKAGLVASSNTVSECDWSQKGRVVGQMPGEGQLANAGDTVSLSIAEWPGGKSCRNWME